jgi:tetratricopeptide (TPR) repeat protein
VILQSPKPPPRDLHFQHKTQDDEWISSSYFTPPQIRLDATDRLIRRDGRQPAWILNRARAVYELDRFSEALELFDEYLKIKPDDKQARIWREQVERMR